MRSTLTKYRFLVVLVALGIVVLLFRANIVTWLSQGGSQKSNNGQVGVMIPTPSDKPLTIIQYCRDTKPLYTLGQNADRAVANNIDSFVQFDTGGMVFYASYIASHSYEHNAISFTIPSVAKQIVPPPAPQYGSDAFKNTLLKDAYEKALAAFRVSSSIQQKNLAVLRVQVHQETNTMRTLPDIFDDKGSDPLGCIALAAQHFQGQAAVKELLIASDMVTTTSMQSIGHISLTGVSVKLIYRTCLLGIAARCQSDNAYWTRFFITAGAKEVQILDPAQSQVSF